MNRRPRAGLQDVARAAGVSRSTASRALRGEARVSSETIELVRNAANSLGYVRDLRAAELASTAPTTVGLLLRGAERSFYGEIAARVQNVTDARGIDLLIVNGGDDHGTQLRGLENLLGHRVGGIMVASGRASLEAVEYAATFVPTILVGHHSSHSAIDSVCIDVSSERLIARKVVETGHRRVAIVAADAPGSTVLKQRIAQYRLELTLGGADVSVLHGADDKRALSSALQEVLRDGVTAIMAGDDPTAVEILELLAEWGLSCPEDVSVTGFDGVGIFRSPLFGLTTMRQPVELMAHEATELMMARLNETQKPVVHETYPGEYIPGKTLGPRSAKSPRA